MTENKDRRRNSKKGNKRFILLFIVCILIVISVLLPLPYYIEMPGTGENIKEFVSVNNRENEHDGAYLLMTVAVRPATPASIVVANLSSFKDVISKKDLMGDNDDEEFDKLSDYQMKTSEDMAKKVAMDLAGEPYHFAYKGVYVMNVADKSNFKGHLKTGDIVYRVDDVTFNSADEFMAYVQQKNLTDKVKIDYTRDGKSYSTTEKLMELDKEKRVGLGITLVDQKELETDKQIVIEADDIGGPSGGLMFTLELYELLSGKDLRKGRIVAGTGTIASDGVVGSIGGIDKKIVAADREGAEIFFAPDEPVDKKAKKKYPDLMTNYEEAKKAADKIGTKMKVVPVRNVDHAIAYLGK